jgi:hypothetical protein
MSVIRLTITYCGSARHLELANWRVFVAKPRLIRPSRRTLALKW